MKRKGPTPRRRESGITKERLATALEKEFTFMRADREAWLKAAAGVLKKLEEQ